jgi:carboxymethylenebutenolidase
MREELLSLLGKNEYNRRQFMVTSLTTGFALAVQPINAQSVITTDTSGLVAGEVKIPTTDGEIPAYRAMPDKGKNFPAVLVVSEIFGVHEHIRDVCRRFAKLGHLAVAPEMFVRHGDVAQLANIQEVFKIVQKAPDAQVMSDLDATVAWMKKNNGNTSKLGVTGFCWGGRITWMYAAHNPRVKAGVAWYGRLVPGQPNPLQPKHPIDIAASLKVPVLGLYGALDKGIPVADVEKMKAALKVAKSKSDIVLYPQADHGFHADYRPTYNAEAAKDGVSRLQAWFKKHGAA